MFKILAEGGVFMWPLLFGSALAVAIGIERLMFFLRLKKAGPDFRKSLALALDSGDLAKANSLCAGEDPARSCARAALKHWDDNGEIVDAAILSEAKECEPALERFLGVLETIVTGAPLIGLLGTITGMMGVFRSVAAKLGSDPHANTTGITAGIGEALVATATGILVAVIALFLHSVFQSMAESRMTELEQTAETLRLSHLKKKS